MVPYVAALVVSSGVALFARLVKLDRDRAFYPTVMIVIALYYVLFAVMSGSVQTVVVEVAVMTLFAAAAVAGFKSSDWIVVAALAGHGVMDAIHGQVIDNSGVPPWWPAWCFTYDIWAAALFGWLLLRDRRRRLAGPESGLKDTEGYPRTRQGGVSVKAILHTQYGPPERLQLVEVETPTPKANEVLISVRATTVSTGDCNVRNFTFVTRSMRPIAKLMFGITKPWKPRVLGTELAGEVLRVGNEVTKFKPGDRVVASTGAAGGGHAQNTALYFLRDLGRIQAGQDVLIIGASGAIGSAAVQLAKHVGARVTGVCSGTNAELVKGMGADRVIDYTRENFAKDGSAYDLIFDVVGATTFEQARQSLKSDGVFLQNIMELSDIGRVLWTSITGGRKVKGGVAIGNLANMNLITALAEAGTVRAVIDRTYPMARSAVRWP